MKKLSIFIIRSSALAVFCLMFGSPSKWFIHFPTVLLMSFVLIIFNNRRSFWLPTICFSVYTILAIWGLLEQPASILLICGEVFAFSAWELIVFKNDLKGDQKSPALGQLINEHLRILFPVIVITLLISLLFLNIQFQLPFPVLLLTGALGIFGFFRFYRISNK